MLKWIAQNKYKLMAFMVGLYLLADVMQHKGQARVLFAKQFRGVQKTNLLPGNKNTLTCTGKKWKKGINSIDRLNELDTATAGFECDVYFDTTSNFFDVHHDPDKSSGFNLSSLLQQYQQKKLTACIWLDIKNLSSNNAGAALQSLQQLQKQYGLQNKLLIESDRADLLTPFSDSGFYTSYYVPFFNPYKLNDAAIQSRADSISADIGKARIDALSGYYFQCGFLNHYFPNYPLLTWVDDAPFSLVNCIFQYKIQGSKAIRVMLKT